MSVLSLLLAVSLWLLRGERCSTFVFVAMIVVVALFVALGFGVLLAL